MVQNALLEQMLEEIFERQAIDIFDIYDKIKKDLHPAEYSVMKTVLRKKIETEETINTNNILLIASVMKLIGSDDQSILDFFLRFLRSQLTIKQYNFVLQAIFRNEPPLSSDKVYDIFNYTYLDQRYIYRTACKLTKAMKKRFNASTALYLFLSSFRQDLSNENRVLILLILNDLAPQLKAQSIDNSLLEKYKRYAQREKKTSKKPFNIEKEVSKRVSSSFSEDKQSSDRKQSRIESESEIPDRADQQGEKRHLTLKEKPKRAQGRKKLPAIPKSAPLSPSKATKIRSLYPVLSLLVVFFLLFLLSRWSSRKNQSGKPVETTEIDTVQRSEENALSQRTDEGSSSDEEAGRRELYTIRWGDTLSSISKQFYNDPHNYDRIAEKNSIENPHLIYSGDTIVIPRSREPEE